MTIKTITGWAMLLLGLFALAGAVADSKLGTWFIKPDPAVVSAPLAGIDRVSVSAGTAQIRITAADRPDLAVTLSGGQPGSVNVDLVRLGDELQVRLSSPWWHSPRFSAPTTVEIWLPSTFHEALAVKAVKGNLTITGATLASLAIDVGTAKVDLRNVSTDVLTYKGRTGALSAERVQAGQADLRLITGKIELAHHAGAVQTHLTTGSLLAQFDTLTGPVTVDQTTGELRLDLPDDAAFTLDATVGRGSVTNGLPPAATAASGQKAVHGRYGAGTHAVTLRVGTGMITIR